MKKLMLTFAALSLFAGAAAAQDMAKATEIYNSAAEAYSMGDKESALSKFQSALKEASACGEAGADIVSNCKEYIPTLSLSIAKDLVRDKNYEAAIIALKEVIAVAEEYENIDAAEQASELLPKTLTLKAKSLIGAKDIEGAVATCREALQIDTTNGTAWLYLGQALAIGGKTDEAVEAYKSASANGQGAIAKKQISTIFLKNASTALKEKDYAGAISAALQANEYVESANAYKIAGTAATSLQKNADAIAYLSKYLELSPKAADAAQISEAIEALKKL